MDAQLFSLTLPDVVQAIFYPTAGNRPHALSVHARFASAFGLGAAELPLLELDLTGGRGDAPFSIAPPHTGAEVLRAHVHGPVTSAPPLLALGSHPTPLTSSTPLP